MGNVYTANYIPKNILFYLWEKEINTVVLKQDPGIRGAVTSHPDLFLCKMGVEADAPLIRAPKGSVGSAYPENAAYCAACLDKYLIHNLKITAPEILEKARQMGKTPVHVEQGYTRCNLVVVDGRSVITADEGICRTLSGLAVASFPMAKNTGLAHTFAEAADKKRVRTVLIVFDLALCAGMCLCGIGGALMALAAHLVFLCYFRMSRRQFGGLSGDLAGWFLVQAEKWMLIALTLWQFTEVLL